jgi:hypothetical protein
LDRRRSEGSTVILAKHVYDQIAQSGLCSAERRIDIDGEALKKCLSHAWGIEFLLYANHEAIEDDTVIRMANNWACIQAYYVFYHATQAIWVAKGHPRPETHEITQKTFLNLWTGRKADLVPWALGYGADGVRGVPVDQPIDHEVQNLKSFDPQNCWSLAAKALETTREKKLPECLDARRKEKKRARIKAWEEAEQARKAAAKRPRNKPSFPLPQLSSSEKIEVENRLRVHTLMDYLYRLRIKSNYEDAG